MKSQGILSIEKALDQPTVSEIFHEYPALLSNSQATEFFCDYMRLISMGFDDHYQLDECMHEEIEIMSEEQESIAGAINNLGDSMPALGIVAAVLGVINAMGNIGGPPEILGKSIGGALVGILLAYAFVNPVGKYLEKYYKSYLEYTNCMRIAVISYMKGNSPIVIAELTRKVIPENLRPNFAELEDLISDGK